MGGWEVSNTLSVLMNHQFEGPAFRDVCAYHWRTLFLISALNHTPHHVNKCPQSGDGPLFPGVDRVPKVGQLDQSLGRHEDILRLDVAVEDALQFNP